jgi:hypothetical protein
MNKYFAIDGSLSPELLKDFYSLVNSLCDGDVINIILNSGGGKIYVGKAISDAINREPDRFTLTGMEHLYSAAFNLFFDAKCERKLLYGTIGMAHQSSKEITINNRGNAYYDGERFELKQSKNYLIHSIKRLIELGVDRKKIRKFKSTDDVFFTHMEMVNMLEKSIELNERNAPTEPATTEGKREGRKNGDIYGGNYSSSVTV